jgi:hypothetical protein
MSTSHSYDHILHSNTGAGRAAPKKAKKYDSDESDDESDYSVNKKKRPIAQSARAPAAPKAVVPKVEAAKTSSSTNAATAAAVVKAVKQVSLAVKKEKESAPKKKEPEADAPVLDLKARLMLKMAASAAASSSSSSAAPAPVPSAAITVAAPRAHKVPSKPKATLDLCSDESEVEGSTLRGMDSLSLDSKPVRKPQPKKVISRSYDEDDSSSEGEQTKKPKAVRKPRAPASAVGSKVQGVKRPKKATGTLPCISGKETSNGKYLN